MIGRMATALMLSVLTVSSAAAVEWKYSSWTPPNAPNNRFGSIPFMENVTKATNGEVTFKNFMGSQLFNAMTTLQGVRDGVVDAGVTVPAFNAAELKYHTMIAEMQGFTRDGYSAAGAATETVLLNCPECMAEYDKNNTRMLGTYSSPTWFMQCAFEPKTVADLKGTKLGASGTASNARLAAAFGQTRITGGPGDYLQSMTNRAIDCVIGPKEWLKSISLKDAVKTVIDNQGVGHFVAISIMTVNKNSWAKLTDSQRAAFLAEMPRAIARTTHGYHAEEELGAKEGQAKGVKLISLGQEFVDVWQRYLKTERGDVIEQGKKVGIANAEDLVSRYEKNIKKWEAIIDRVGKSEESLAKALQDEVFSKVKM